VGPRLPQLPGGGVQRLVLGVHHEVVPVQRELPGELAADSAGRAGDQGEWPCLSHGGRVTALPPAKHRRGLRRPGHRSVPTGGDGRARRGRRFARIRTVTQEASHPGAPPCTGLTRRAVVVDGIGTECPWPAPRCPTTSSSGSANGTSTTSSPTRATASMVCWRPGGGRTTTRS